MRWIGISKSLTTKYLGVWRLLNLHKYPSLEHIIHKLADKITSNIMYKL